MNLILPCLALTAGYDDAGHLSKSAVLSIYFWSFLEFINSQDAVNDILREKNRIEWTGRCVRSCSREGFTAGSMITNDMCILQLSCILLTASDHPAKYYPVQVLSPFFLSRH